MSLIEEVSAYLEAQGQGTLGQDLFHGPLPKSKVEAVSVIPSSGSPHVVMERPSFQVLIRRLTFREAQEKATSVYGELHDKWNVLSTYQGRIWAAHEPGPFWVDEDQHFVFSLNFMATFA